MTDQLSSTFAALADPTRRAIIARLSEGQASPSDLAEPFLDRMSRPAVTKHLKVLEKAGLIERSRDAQRRPCELKPEALKEASDWVEQYREFWEESLDRLGEYLQKVTGERAAATESSKPKNSPSPRPSTPRKKHARQRKTK